MGSSRDTGGKTDELRARTKAYALQIIRLTEYWMELIVESGLVQEGPVTDLYREADGIPAMTVASIKTARSRA